MNKLDNATKNCLEFDAGRRLKLPTNNLIYFSIVRMILWGTVNGKPIGPFRAESGAGLTNVGKQASMKYSRLDPYVPTRYRERAEISDENRGGAIVPGLYAVPPDILRKGERHKLSIWGGAPTDNSMRLYPLEFDRNYMSLTRNSFYIHGNAGKGSDGCIALDPIDRLKLINAIKKGGGAYLRAYLSGRELSDAFEKSEVFDRTT